MTSLDECLAEYRARHRKAYLERKRQVESMPLTATKPPVITQPAEVHRRIQIEDDERLAREIAASINVETNGVRPPDNQFSERLLDNLPQQPPLPNQQVRYTAYGVATRQPDVPISSEQQPSDLSTTGPLRNSLPSSQFRLSKFTQNATRPVAGCVIPKFAQILRNGKLLSPSRQPINQSLTASTPPLQTPSPPPESEDEVLSDPDEDPEYKRQLREAIARSKADMNRRS